MTLIPGRRTGAKNLSDAERAEIFKLAELDYPVTKIAQELKRHPVTIARFLNTFKSTSRLARAHFDTEAYQLAKRVTADADVDQALEVLDRLDVLPAKSRDSGSGPSVIVQIGMPGQPACTPPAQLFVSRALELEGAKDA